MTFFEEVMDFFNAVCESLNGISLVKQQIPEWERLSHKGRRDAVMALANLPASSSSAIEKNGMDMVSKNSKTMLVL